ncbi:RNA polymerase sigma factor [Caulobacter segnis]|uniref:RNA polymerase sigma factor n=1 Tax=Caulobacter segnis TaxID=88688 RepID=UPI00240F5F78|nr:RNA polymerase sigma factor [Caulobacter segnis]MDG2522387.1 RNA polymerase sigma factor [Caulobacter segnis]
MNTGWSDEALVAKARAGSDAAFMRLVQRHEAALRGFLRRSLGGSAAEAEDVAQEVFLAAWSRLGDLKDAGRVRAWLCGMGWRKAQDRMRTRRRDVARDGAWLEIAEATPGLSAEDRLAVAQAMGELSEVQRACITLCLVEGWSHGEASQALDLPLGTVKSYVERGRARLLAALGGSHDA